MEKTDEWQGAGMEYTTEYRQYDPRLGRWMSLDPMMAQFPWQSPYVGMDNNPVALNDPDGDCTCPDCNCGEEDNQMGPPRPPLVYHWIESEDEFRANIADAVVTPEGSGSPAPKRWSAEGFRGEWTGNFGSWLSRNNLPNTTTYNWAYYTWLINFRAYQAENNLPSSMSYTQVFDKYYQQHYAGQDLLSTGLMLAYWYAFTIQDVAQVYGGGGAFFARTASNAIRFSRMASKFGSSIAQWSPLVKSGRNTGIINNPVPNRLARVIPANINSKTLGAPGATDVFVTAADDIAGLSASQIAQKLTIPYSTSGFRIIEFNTPIIGLGSPINRTYPGFVGFGRTAGGAREFVIPNQVFPKNSVIRLVR